MIVDQDLLLSEIPSTPDLMSSPSGCSSVYRDIHLETFIHLEQVKPEPFLEEDFRKCRMMRKLRSQSQSRMRSKCACRSVSWAASLDRLFGAVLQMP